jgi:hypothetical protein
MRIIFLAAPALLLAGCGAVPVDESGPSAMNAGVSVQPVTFSSAFEDYRRFADQEQQDWRQANEQVGAVGGHGAHK